MLQNALLFSFTVFFFFPFFISPCQKFSLFWLYPSTMEAYIDHPLFSFFFQLYFHIIHFWLLLKLCVPEVEHDERHFFLEEKGKATICCLNSLRLCRALLESTILWISETMKNYFHDLFLIEKWCPSFIFTYHKHLLFLKLEYSILQYTLKTGLYL